MLYWSLKIPQDVHWSQQESWTKHYIGCQPDTWPDVTVFTHGHRSADIFTKLLDHKKRRNFVSLSLVQIEFRLCWRAWDSISHIHLIGGSMLHCKWIIVLVNAQQQTHPSNMQSSRNQSHDISLPSSTHVNINVTKWQICWRCQQSKNGPTINVKWWVQHGAISKY